MLYMPFENRVVWSILHWWDENCPNFSITNKLALTNAEFKTSADFKGDIGFFKHLDEWKAKQTHYMDARNLWICIYFLEISNPAISTNNVSLTSVKHLQPLKIDRSPCPAFLKQIYTISEDNSLGGEMQSLF